MHPKTLADYRKIAVALGGGEENPAVRFFDKKIAEQGDGEIVIAEESQVLMLIASLLFDNAPA